MIVEANPNFQKSEVEALAKKWLGEHLPCADVEKMDQISDLEWQIFLNDVTVKLQGGK